MLKVLPWAFFFIRGVFMVQIFFMFFIVCSAVQLKPSAKSILKKPSTVNPSKAINRIAQHMDRNRKEYGNDKNKYQEFLKTLRTNILDEIKLVQEEQQLYELNLYRSAVQEELESIAQQVANQKVAAFKNRASQENLTPEKLSEEIANLI
jgi:hypothetical protein